MFYAKINLKKNIVYRFMEIIKKIKQQKYFKLSKNTQILVLR